MRGLLPHGLVRINDWVSRFRSLGLDRISSFRASLSAVSRRDLVCSRIEHLPRSLPDPLPLVVDIGANEGQWALALSSFRRISNLHAFEPHPGITGLLEEALAASKTIESFHVDPRALGETEGTATLNLMDSSDLSSLRPPRHEFLEETYSASIATIEREIEVEVVTLDRSLSEASPDLVKIDVQGFEKPVLAGGRATLARTKALLLEVNLVFHYEGDTTLDELFALVTGELGFEFWDLSPAHRGPDGRALWADASFTHPDLLIP